MEEDFNDNKDDTPAEAQQPNKRIKLDSGMKVNTKYYTKY